MCKDVYTKDLLFVVKLINNNIRGKFYVMPAIFKKMFLFS